ncbi:MAG: asparagine synthase (glutamine-hydrolyzing) [Candidatus Omnitrophica bacterium]|nr:asparagine synthase (glutamine-hydrolyzing) [Candidatus Omnitrophota bacterium]
MCGICGDIRTPHGGLAAPGLLTAMNEAQRHRGPDDTGLWCEGPVGLGHQRLAILDLDGGRQPMADSSGQVVVTYNGEIYNFVELREQLRGLGHQFRSTGDTEVLLHAYLEWGLEMLPRLSGMFAFGVYDARRRWLFAARDPMGQKPFLYYQDADGLVFASELTALLRHPRVPRRLDLTAVAGYLVREYFTAPETPLQDVRKLQPGEAMLYEPSTGRLRCWRYWDPMDAVRRPFLDRPPTIEDEETLAQELRTAVERHLRSDVPVGVYLSGGVDSTALAALACDVIGGQNLQTFTIGYADPSFDESAAARRTAQQLGTRHHELRLSPQECVAAVPDAVAHLDEPLADPGYLSVIQAASLASRHVKVVVAGDGGDELLCGYETFKVWEAADWMHRQLPAGVRGLLRACVALTPAQYGYMGLGYRARYFLRGLDVPAAWRNTCWIGAFTPDEARAVLRGGDDTQSLRGDHGWPTLFDHVQELHRLAARHDGLTRLGLEYQQTYLPGAICAHTDKANMRFSLEARSPLLDPAVVQCLNRLPSSWKLRGWQSKWLLRRWLTRRLGRALPVKKHGFAAPLALWLRRELRTFAETHLNRDAIEAAGVFHPEKVARLWQEHAGGRANHAKPLWTVLVFQVWHRQHLQAPVAREAATRLTQMKEVAA